MGVPVAGLEGIEVLDWAALGWFVLCAAGYHLLTSRPALFERSISGAIQRQRLAWMRGMAARVQRSEDAILHSTLSSGNAFFASTSAIAIGGLASIVGSGSRADAVLSQMPFVAHSTPLLWEIKVLLLIGIFVFAFFKFAWAFRLTHYTSIMIGAMPNPGTADAATVERQAAATAEISGLAAGHSNSGLRSFYYAAAVMAWFFGPVLFATATAWVAIILVRRDFFSRSRLAIAGALG